MNRPAQRFKQIAFVAASTPEAREAYDKLSARYGNAEPAKADVIVALGGDGLMLQTLHKFMNSGKPIYGMHRGTVGFLMNEFAEQDLAERLNAAHLTVIHPLVMRARDAQGREHEHRAINEVSLFRQSAQAAHLRILIDGQERLTELVADGVLVATPAGSTAYNLSAQGADHPDQRAAAGAHPDQPVPAAALARRAAAGPRQGDHRGAGSRQAPGGGGRRPRRSALGARRRHQHGSRRVDRPAVRSRPQSRRTHFARAVRLLARRMILSENRFPSPIVVEDMLFGIMR